MSGNTGARLSLCTIGIVQFLALLDTSIVSVALPSISRELSMDPGVLQWVLGTYAISYAGFVLLGGRGGDLFGRRRTLLAGLVLLAAGSLVAGVAGSAAVLLAGRLVQGLGAAVTLPSALALIVTTFRPGPARDRAFALWAASGGFALVFGGLIGGAITTAFGWRAVFLVNIPLVLVAVVLAVASPFPPDTARADRRMDMVGAFAIAGCLALLVYGTAETQRIGHGGGTALVALTGAVLLAFLFVVAERRAATPLVRFGLFRQPGVTAANLLALLFPAGFLAPLFLGTLLLQDVLHFAPFDAGLATLPFSVVVSTVILAVPRLVSVFGARRVACLGFVLLTAGLVVLATTGGTDYAGVVLPAFVLLGIGSAVASVPLAMAAVGRAAHGESGMASGVFSTSQQAGSAVMVAGLAAITAAWTSSGTPDHAAALDGGLRVAFLCAAVLTAVGALGSLALPRARTGGGPVAQAPPARDVVVNQSSGHEGQIP